MWWWHGSWGGWLLMGFVMVAFWAVVIWAVATLVRGTASAPTTREPESILAERFARGEIDADDYTTRLESLRTQDGQPVGRR